MEHWVCDAGRVNCQREAGIDLGSLSPDYLWIALVVLALAGLWWVMHKLSGVVRYVPNGRVGIVERLWSPHGSVGDGRIIALHGRGWLSAADFARRDALLFPVYVSDTFGAAGYGFARNNRVCVRSRWRALVARTDIGSGSSY